MIGLTRRQLQALQFITGYVETYGESPTMRELSAGLGYPHVGPRVVDLVTALCERGYLRRNGLRSRNTDLLRKVSIPRAPDGVPLHFVNIGDNRRAR